MPGRILAVGVATLDLISRVDRYPAEDAEVRASAAWRSRGGNATNTLVALAQWGHACAWAGTISADAEGDFVLADLQRYGIATDAVWRIADARLPISQIILSQATGGRTIVHFRDLPEYSAARFARIDLRAFDWIHFEGRNVPQLLRMLARLRDHGGPRCSVEIEKPREGIEAVIGLADLVLYSRQYAVAQGFSAAEDFLRHLPGGHPEAYCAWGEAGAWARARDAEILHAPAFPPHQVIDTLAAGDVFNAGVIDARLRGLPPSRSVEWACRVAGYKCGQQGLERLAEAGAP